MSKRIFARTAAVIAAALVLVGVSAGPAMADVIGTGGTAYSYVSTGSTQYTFGADGRDFGWDATEVDPLQMRWKSCRSTAVGAWVTIDAYAGRQVIGRNFLKGTCLVFQWRLYSGTGPRTFRGWAHWNYNFA